VMGMVSEYEIRLYMATLSRYSMASSIPVADFFTS
jgi:hypothetical protein